MPSPSLPPDLFEGKVEHGDENFHEQQVGNDDVGCLERGKENLPAKSGCIGREDGRIAEHLLVEQIPVRPGGGGAGGEKTAVKEVHRQRFPAPLASLMLDLISSTVMG